MKPNTSKHFAAFAACLLAASIPARASVCKPSNGVFLPDDLTDIHPGVASAPDEFDGYPAANAFDNNTSTTAGRWLSTYTEKQQDDSEVGELQWTFSDGPQVVRAYRLMSHVETDVSRAPRSWTFHGSNDGGASWDMLDEMFVKDITPWSQGESRVFSFDNDTAYTTYRFSFRCTGGTGAGRYIGLQEVEFFENVDQREDMTLTAELTGNYEDLTSSGSGNVSASSGFQTFTGDKMFDNSTARESRWLAVPSVIETMPDVTDAFSGAVSGSSSHADWPASRAFDGDATTANGRWLASVQSGDEKAWIQWSFDDGPHAIGGYGFKAHITGLANRAPSAWTLLGSNDGGETWAVVDSVSGEGTWALGEERLFECDSPGAYQFFRFSFSKGGSDYIGLSEIELYSTESMAGNSTGRAWVQYVFDEPTVVDQYALSSYPAKSGGPERCPTAWRLMSSDDGITWTLADRRSNEDVWDDAVETRLFTFINATPHAYWRLVLDGVGTTSGFPENYGYVGFSEMELRHAGTTVRTSSTTSGGVGDFALDGDFTSTAHAWLARISSNGNPAWLVYDFGRRVIIDGYGLAGLASATERNPTAWTLYGSNDNGVTWETIDSRSDFATWGSRVARRFDAASPMTCKLVKLTLDAGGANGVIGLQEVEIYGSEVPPGTCIIIR